MVLLKTTPSNLRNIRHSHIYIKAYTNAEKERSLFPFFISFFQIIVVRLISRISITHLSERRLTDREVLFLHVKLVKAKLKTRHEIFEYNEQLKGTYNREYPRKDMPRALTTVIFNT